MKFVVGGVLALIILFFAVPMLAGGSTNVCKDLASHNVKTTASTIAGGNSGLVYNTINGIGQAGVTGQGEQAAQATQHPNTPSMVSCTTAFWQSL